VLIRVLQIPAHVLKFFCRLRRLAVFLAPWTGPDPFLSKYMLLVCDNASVHTADEHKKLMEKYGIILMFLPPNMTQWLQPLARVVCDSSKQCSERAEVGTWQRI